MDRAKKLDNLDEKYSIRVARSSHYDENYLQGRDSTWPWDFLLVLEHHLKLRRILAEDFCYDEVHKIHEQDDHMFLCEKETR